MKNNGIKMLPVAAVCAFIIISCAALYVSLRSDAAPIRDAIPTINVDLPQDNELAEITPVGELPGYFVEEVDAYEQYREQAREIAASMTDDEKLYQLFIVTPELLTGYSAVFQAGSITERALSRYPVGGLIYFSSNLKSTAQTSEMLAKTQEYSKIPLFLGVDEEGGRVARISGNTAYGYDAIAPMSEIGALGDFEAAYNTGVQIGEMLRSLGFNLDFAPVADVLINPENKEIGNRAFGSEPELVADMTSSFTEGLRSTGMASCLKHFPGHGSTAADSHNGYSQSDRTLDELRAVEFFPFKSGISAGTDFVMMSHMTAVNIDAQNPASLSELVTTRLLREELGYDRLIITDSLKMGAITKNFKGGEAAVLALEAGADMVLMPDNLANAVKAVRDAIGDGRLTRERIDESIERILLVKLERGIIPADYALGG